MISKSVLRPQYSSTIINSQIKRLRISIDTIRQIQFESSVSSIHDEFNDYERTDSSTPKKSITSTLINEDYNLENLQQEVNQQFEEDDNDKTILADVSTSSNQSLASFLSAVSTNENSLTS